MKPEQEKEIREILSFKNDWTLSATQGRALLAEIDRLRHENQNIKIDQLNLESADNRYECLYEITHSEIEDLKKKLAITVEALEKIANPDSKTLKAFFTFHKHSTF